MNLAKIFFAIIVGMRISKTNQKEVDEFEKEEWPYADMEHYGEKVKYNNKKFMFKATEKGTIVGMIQGKLESGVVTIDYLIVGHDYYRKGIGKALTKWVEDFAWKEKAHKLHLMTGKDWQAEKFYKKLGYKKVAILPKHNFKKDFVVYEKLV